MSHLFGGEMKEYTLPDVEALGLPISQETAFTTPKGLYSEKIEKRQRRMLEKYETVLKQFLELGEEILLVMRGCSPTSLVEQVTSGWTTFFLKRCVLVVTNRRILHFPSRMNFSPRHSVAQIRFDDVESIALASSFRRRFTVKYKNGKKETFRSLNESTKLKAIIPELQLGGERTTLFRMRHHLCPKCAFPLESKVSKCSKCGLGFKSIGAAAFFSVLLPGGGFFYTRHPFLGILGAVGEIILAGLFVFSHRVTLFEAVDPARRQMIPLVLGIAFLFAKIIAMYHAIHFAKEYIPREQSLQQ